MARRLTGEHGAALVELAICMPFLAVIIFGTIDIGRVYQTSQQAKNAAREGAMYASRYPGRQAVGLGCANPDTVTWHANNESATTFTIRVNNATPTCTTSLPASLAAGQPIKVTASTTFQPFTPLANVIFGDDPVISSSVCVNIAGATPDPTAVCP